jgi:hypothetical protein
MALMIGNANHFSNIEQINSDKGRWNFRAKIIRLSQVSNFKCNNNLFSIEMVLIDSKGGRIHTTTKENTHL